MRLQRRGTVLVVALWRLCSSAPGLLNIYNKLVLKAISFPYTITAFQFAFSSLLIFLMWVTRLHSVPKLSPTLLAKIMSLDVGHMLGTEFTNMSLGKVVVSFMHTVKASEPFFTILLSAFFLGETPFLLVLGSLVPRCRLGIFDRCFFQLFFKLILWKRDWIFECHGIKSDQPIKECPQQETSWWSRGGYG